MCTCAAFLVMQSQRGYNSYTEANFYLYSAENKKYYYKGFLSFLIIVKHKIVQDFAVI